MNLFATDSYTFQLTHQIYTQHILNDSSNLQFI